MISDAVSLTERWDCDCMDLGDILIELPFLIELPLTIVVVCCYGPQAFVLGTMD